MILQGDTSRSLFYARDSPLQLHAYSDSTWASDPTDRQSITGYCIILGSSPIAWKSNKQTTVSHSSAKCEHSLPLLQKSYGFDGYWLILGFLVMLPHLFYVTIQELYRLPMILWSMNLPSISVSMLSLLGIIVINIPLLFSMCHPSCNWLTSLLKRKLESNIGSFPQNQCFKSSITALSLKGGVKWKPVCWIICCWTCKEVCNCRPIFSQGCSLVTRNVKIKTSFERSNSSQAVVGTLD